MKLMRRCPLAALIVLVLSLAIATSAQAAVVNDGGTSAGVALAPGTTFAHVTSTAPCTDPWLAGDLGGPSFNLNGGLCDRGGSVMHATETFALTWDPIRSYWAGTRQYVEQFLRDVADGAGSLNSPYAVTTQYRDSGGRAANTSLYGGGCIDYGDPGGWSCVYPNDVAYGPGNTYGASGCSYSSPIAACLTDKQIQGELHSMIPQMGFVGRTTSGYTPLVVVLTPPHVEVCLDSGGALCSANGGSTAKFCSYHSQVDGVAYVVQPWTANTACDEPGLPALGSNPTPAQVASDAGSRIVGPLSQSDSAAIADPGLNGWVAKDGSEIDDNGGCGPQGYPQDATTIGNSSQNPYYLPPEFNNAGVLESDPNAPACAHGVVLSPAFAVPSSVSPGNVVAFDGSVTASTLMVPYADYKWNFGDGKTATGPSVVHSYAAPGTYNVTLTVTDRGGNTRSLRQTMDVLGPGISSPPGVHVRVELLPEGLRNVLRSGMALIVTSNTRADGFVSISISRSAADRAHIKHGRGSTVVIGRGTVSGIKNGKTRLDVRLSSAVGAKLMPLHHVTLTIKLTLITPGGGRVVVAAAGRY